MVSVAVVAAILTVCTVVAPSVRAKNIRKKRRHCCSARKSRYAGSGPHGLTGMAWWAVSRAVEFAGGAAYGFLPGFQDAEEAGGERGGEGDDTKEASGEH